MLRIGLVRSGLVPTCVLCGASTAGLSPATRPHASGSRTHPAATAADELLPLLLPLAVAMHSAASMASAAVHRTGQGRMHVILLSIGILLNCM